MLQAIRDRVTGIVAWAIVVLISIPFALWGIQEYFGAAASVAVATVDGEEVSLPRYRRYYQRQRGQLQQMLGGTAVPPALEQGLRQRALEQLIGEEVALRNGIDDGFAIGDQQLLAAIQSDAGFEVDGKFSQEAYQQFLRTQGLSGAGFEQEVRRDIMLRQLSQGLGAGALVTNSELERLSLLRSQKRTARLLIIQKDSFTDVEITPEEIQAHYDTNRDDYKTPEKVDIVYVEVSRKSVADSISVDDDDIAARYEQTKGNYRVPEQREVSHILVGVVADAPDEEVEAARKQIEAIAQALNDGAEFAELAKTKSQDPGSARQGGSLGSFGKGVMDPAFEKAAFGLEPGVVSEPVRSNSGFHLIKVDRIEEEQERPLETVRGDLRVQMQMERAEKDYFDQVEQLATLSFEQPGSLDAAADALGVSPVRLEGLTRNSEDSMELLDELAADRSVIAAAFSDEVLEDGNNSEVLEPGGERALVLRVVDRHPAKDRPLDEVRDTIQSKLVDAAARERAQEAGRRAVASLRDGTPAADVAAELSVEWAQAEAFDRQAAGVDAQVLEQLFKLPLPEADGGPVFDAIAAYNGDFAIIEFAGTAHLDKDAVVATSGSSGGSGDDAQASSSQATSPEERLEAERERLAQTMPGIVGQGEFDAYMAELRSNADVVINEESMQ